MRTFIAILLPTLLQEVIARRQSALRTQMEQARIPACIRWTAPQKIHLTLRFLGETSTEQRAQIREEFAAASQQWTPFALSLGPYGCFPTCRRPSVVWLGVDGDMKTLVEIQTQVEQSVQRAGFGAEKRRFRPHLTIGRADRQASAAQLGQMGDIVQKMTDVDVKAPDDEVARFAVEEIAHVRSQLRPSGAVYSVLDVFPLQSIASP